MNVEQALSKIRAPKGITSLINGVLSGDFEPIRDQSAVGESLVQAEARLAEVQAKQAACTSDWAYWGYEGDKAYWAAVVDILKAAEITGPESLPDIDGPTLEGKVVMDACAAVERFGRHLRQAAEAQRETQ